MALKEAMSPEFKQYQQQIVHNCKALADELIRRCPCAQHAPVQLPAPAHTHLYALACHTRAHTHKPTHTLTLPHSLSRPHSLTHSHRDRMYM